jgi:hypothetical protein
MKNDLIERVTYLIERDELNKRNRRKNNIYKKCFLMNQLRKEELTFQEIGAYFNQNHASVIHNVQTHKNLMQFNSEEYLDVIREYMTFLVDSKYIQQPRDIYDDVMKCTSLYKLLRVKRWIAEGRYNNLQDDATLLEV